MQPLMLVVASLSLLTEAIDYLPFLRVPECREGISEPAKAERHYFFDLEPGQYAKVVMYGGSGDADIYVNEGAMVSGLHDGKLNSHGVECMSRGGGNDEECRYGGATEGETVYLMIKAYTAFSGLTLCVEDDTPTTAPTPAPVTPEPTQCFAKYAGCGEWATEVGKPVPPCCDGMVCSNWCHAWAPDTCNYVGAIDCNNPGKISAHASFAEQIQKASDSSSNEAGAADTTALYLIGGLAIAMLACIAALLAFSVCIRPMLQTMQCKEEDPNRIF